MFIRNCWYVIAWDHEIPHDGLFSRTALNEPLLLLRTSDGAIHALEDRCCHRLAPLSLGRREGDCVRCGYHGLKFDAAGRCVEIPGLEEIPATAKVRSYPVATKNRWVFVWMGDPAGADTALLPDNFSCEHPQWHNKPGYLRYDAPWLLICDNLLDFSHLAYVHEKTLGGSTAIAQARPGIEQIERGIRVTRHIPDIPAPPFYQKFHHFDTNLDRWFVYDFVLPGTLLMHSGGKPVGDAEGDMRNAVQLHSCQTLTPETETSTHYFFQQSHGDCADNDAVTESIYNSLLGAFEEDRTMIAAQHRSIAARPDAEMLALPMDGALVRFRRLVSDALAREQTG